MRDDLRSSYGNHPWFDRNCLNFINDRNFKTEMTQAFYGGARGAFIVPSGMRIKFQTLHGPKIFGEGHCFIFEVSRFYASQGGVLDRHLTFCIPEQANDLSISTLDSLPRIPSCIGKASFGGSETMMYIPLSWITHLVHDGHGDGISDVEVVNVNSHRHPIDVDVYLKEAIKQMVLEKSARECDEVRIAMSMLPR